MKGIILSGGSGTRLRPLTKITSKQLLPIYNRPMIYYPLNSLLVAGIRDILIIVAPERAGDYLNLLGSGKEFGAKFTYEIQERPRGIAEAFLIGESFLDGENVALILGDNIFEDDFTEAIRTFERGARIFAKQVPDPERFGVVKFDRHMKAVSIEEKPRDPASEFAIPGFYLYDDRAVRFSKDATPSARGELEVTDIHRRYLEQGELDVRILEGEWIDAGTFDSLLRASVLAREKLANRLII